MAFESTLSSLAQDIRYGLRGLRASPRTTIAAVACIALGIGSAVFMVTLINAVLLRRAPFPDADRLVRVWTAPETGGSNDDLSFLDFRDVREAARSFETLEMASRTRFAITTFEGTERVRGESVTPGYFGLIDLRPALGRLFADGEYLADGERVMILGHDLWQRRFGGRPDIVGQTVRARGTGEPANAARLFTVVGVMPPAFVGTVDPDVSEFWIPAAHYAPSRHVEDRTSRAGWPIGLLRPGVSLTEAQAEIQRIGRNLGAAYPSAYRATAFRVEPFGESWRSKVDQGLLTLLAAALLLLAIACANIANLLLARLAQREQELTVRAILGASWRRIARQLLIESVVLSALGGGAGALVAFLGVRLFSSARVIQLPAYVALSPDLGVVTATIGAVVLTGILFGVLPAWLGSRGEASARLREGGRSATSQGLRQRRFGRALVVLEVAFTFVLLVGSVLLLRSYRNLVHSDLGYRSENLLRLAVSLDPAQFPDGRAQLEFARQAKERLASQPGVRGVSFVAGVLPPWFDHRADLAVEGRTIEALRGTGSHSIDGDFLATLDIRLLRGRNLDRRIDRAEGPPVALVSQSLARRLAEEMGGRDVLGASVQFVADAPSGRLAPAVTVVGVVEDVRYHGPLHPRAADHDLYLPIDQSPGAVLSIAVLADPAIDPAGLIAPLQGELGRLAPTSPQHWISTMRDELHAQYGDARFHAYLTGIYAASALLLAVLGLYSVLSHNVSRRRGEIGIRLAVGAQGRDIVRLVVGEGMRTLAVGLAVGAALALLGARILASQLHGVPPHDRTTFVLVALALLALGSVASLLPARRAALADPLDVLRGPGAGTHAARQR